ncbi:phosphoesterase [Wolbachia endosymbiont of Cruorifilaria tuberocauda]|uniref:metallophosphoesterase family protein n=1 Tax=Wolbachia endosymbiont of Cruorifilaria tuberocauda TaxID=1812111 RepID=UPI00158E1711|nr:metallophosphoesterase [Wolbachia endosymbiont of Cruorifilaria tuberocauda]QKX01798.1 phosphoesterase [Wolbachia endosymbiont of Cruorifilaria tuberocauda]
MNISNILVFLTLPFITSLYSLHAQAQILYTWSQVIPENKLSVRAIIENDTCPTAHVDGEKVEMLSRSSINKGNYTETVCELITKTSTKNISINNTKIPTLPEKIGKIAFIGDTGCRINAFLQQECNSTSSWPLKKNLDSIALHKPDLTIHVGDYHYRKKKCRNKKKCGNVYGHNKEVWYADWFNPAKNILSQSSFLFVRGNHEDCNRAYEGWFRYLDPYPLSSRKCANCIPSWFLDAGPIRFFVFDSSSAKDIFINQRTTDIFEKQFDKLIQANSSKPTWFLTHKPLWKFPKKEFLTLKSHGNLTQIKAFGDKFPSNIATIVSGHIHIAQMLLMNNVPDQIIVGNGGALLHAQDQKSIYRNVEFNYPNNKNYLAHEVRNFFGFGFAILNLDNHEFTFYTQDNKEMYSVKLTEDFKLTIY